MSRILVWDLPTRLFHWLLTATVIGALGLALFADDDGGAFQLHMVLGLVAGFLVLLRLIWGLIGSRYARFDSFLFGPRALIEYLLGVLRSPGQRQVGHNPGSAYAVYAMLLLTLGLALSGLLMSSSEILEEVHEPMAHGMFLVVAGHVAGVVLHTIRHRENIALSMFDGRKSGEATAAITSSHPGAAALFLALVIGWTALVLNGHDAQTGQLTLLGRSFSLSEAEEEHEQERHERPRHAGERRGHRHGRERHHDDDD